MLKEYWGSLFLTYVIDHTHRVNYETENCDRKQNIYEGAVLKFFVTNLFKVQIIRQSDTTHEYHCVVNHGNYNHIVEKYLVGFYLLLLSLDPFIALLI